MSNTRKRPDILEELEQMAGSSFKKQETETKSSRLKLVKSAKKHALSPFFYKVSNHHELFKIGQSFYEDFKNGIKSFAISSTGYQNSQQRSILGLASFFDHQERLKICIVSDNLYLGAFKELIDAGSTSELSFESTKKHLEVINFHEHFDFLEMGLILELVDQETEDFEEIIDEILDRYDVVFWDVPELYKIQAEKQLYFPIIMRFDSLSIIVAKSASSREEVEDLKSFFLGYGINLKGLLVENVTAQGKKTEGSELEQSSGAGKKSWWKGFWK